MEVKSKINYNIKNRTLTQDIRRKLMIDLLAEKPRNTPGKEENISENVKDWLKWSKKVGRGKHLQMNPYCHVKRCNLKEERNCRDYLFS